MQIWISPDGYFWVQFANLIASKQGRLNASDNKEQEH